MKKLFTLLLISIAFISQQSTAQIQKGQKLLGGTFSLGFNESKNQNNESESFGISLIPQLGFGVGGNWILGVRVGFGHGVNKSNSFQFSNRNTDNSYTAGVFARKFFPIGERFGIFGQGEIYYGHAANKYKETNLNGTFEGKNKSHQYVVAIKPGAFFKASQKFIVEAGFGSIGYSKYVSNTASGRSESSGFGISLTNTLNLGFQVIL